MSDKWLNRMAAGLTFLVMFVAFALCLALVNDKRVAVLWFLAGTYLFGLVCGVFFRKGAGFAFSQAFFLLVVILALLTGCVTPRYVDYKCTATRYLCNVEAINYAAKATDGLWDEIEALKIQPADREQIPPGTAQRLMDIQESMIELQGRLTDPELREHLSVLRRQLSAESGRIIAANLREGIRFDSSSALRLIKRELATTDARNVKGSDIRLRMEWTAQQDRIRNWLERLEKEKMEN